MLVKLDAAVMAEPGEVTGEMGTPWNRDFPVLCRVTFSFNWGVTENITFILKQTRLQCGAECQHLCEFLKDCDLLADSRQLLVYEFTHNGCCGHTVGKFGKILL